MADWIATKFCIQTDVRLARNKPNQTRSQLFLLAIEAINSDEANPSPNTQPAMLTERGRSK